MAIRLSIINKMLHIKCRDSNDSTLINKQMKKELRERIKNEKKKYSLEQKKSEEQNIFNAIEKLHQFKIAKNIGLYHALKDEVQTEAFLNKWSDTKHIYIPHVDNQSMTFHRYFTNMKLERSQLGVLESNQSEIINAEKIDLMIVPGIAFDVNCNRLGRGGGYYDRFLTRTQAYKIGIAYDCQIVEQLKTEAHDVIMDCVVSSSEIYR